jgi:hypothetical protein
MHKYFKKKEIKLFNYINNILDNCKWLTLTTKNWQRTKTAVFEGDMSPTASKFKYNLRIICSEKKFPKIFVTNITYEERRPEHLYEDNSLCLFYPSANEYKQEDLIFPKLIDWTALWLYYYEIWLYTNEWYGGGISHNKKENKNV